MSGFAPEETTGVIEHEYGAETPPSIALVRAIYACEGVDPMDATTDFGFVLHDYVDPAALDALLGDGTGAGETIVSFELPVDDTYFVEISDDGRITIGCDRSPS